MVTTVQNTAVSVGTEHLRLPNTATGTQAAVFKAKIIE